MPRRRRLKCRRIFTLLAVVILLPAGAAAQTGRVTLQGHVSETVVLAVSPSFTHGNVNAQVVSSGNTVRITVTSTAAGASVIRVPLLVRSNSGFKITAGVESTTPLMTQLAVTDVRATGRLVSRASVTGLKISEPSDDSLVVSGPRVSLGGTLDSSNNALLITVLIRLQSPPGPGQPVHLTFSATAAPLTQ